MSLGGNDDLTLGMGLDEATVRAAARAAVAIIKKEFESLNSEIEKSGTKAAKKAATEAGKDREQELKDFGKEAEFDIKRIAKTEREQNAQTAKERSQKLADAGKEAEFNIKERERAEAALTRKRQKDIDAIFKSERAAAAAANKERLKLRNESIKRENKLQEMAGADLVRMRQDRERKENQAIRNRDKLEKDAARNRQREIANIIRSERRAVRERIRGIRAARIEEERLTRERAMQARFNFQNRLLGFGGVSAALLGPMGFPILGASFSAFTGSPGIAAATFGALGAGELTRASKRVEDEFTALADSTSDVPPALQEFRESLLSASSEARTLGAEMTRLQFLQATGTGADQGAALTDIQAGIKQAIFGSLVGGADLALNRANRIRDFTQSSRDPALQVISLSFNTLVGILNEMRGAGERERKVGAAQLVARGFLEDLNKFEEGLIKLREAASFEEVDKLAKAMKDLTPLQQRRVRNLAAEVKQELALEKARKEAESQLGGLTSTLSSFEERNKTAEEVGRENREIILLNMRLGNIKREEVRALMERLMDMEEILRIDEEHKRLIKEHKEKLEKRRKLEGETGRLLGELSSFRPELRLVELFESVDKFVEKGVLGAARGERIIAERIRDFAESEEGRRFLGLPRRRVEEVSGSITDSLAAARKLQEAALNQDPRDRVPFEIGKVRTALEKNAARTHKILEAMAATSIKIKEALEAPPPRPARAG